MPSAHAVSHLLASGGYFGLLAAIFLAGLGVGAPIPVTALLLTLGALSGAAGGPNLLAMACVALVGAVGGHLTDYWCGRLGTRLTARWIARLLRRFGSAGAGAALLRWRGGETLLIFVTRFLLTPIASPVSLLAGARRMRFALYLGLEALGTALYVLGNLLLGRAFGPGLARGGLLMVGFWLAVLLLTLAPILLLRLAGRFTRTAEQADSATIEVAAE